MTDYDYPPEEKENECEYCGEPCDNHFCNRECEKAHLQDMDDEQR